MEIQELFIRHYGKLENHRISLKSGVNIIYGGNETGKSTIHSFIGAMLFGLEYGHGKGSRAGEYQLRRPWDHPAYFSGSMIVRENGMCYRIDRNFDSRGGELRMTDLTAECEIPDPEAKLRELTGGISEAAFRSTVFVTQTQGGTGEAIAQELRQCMGNGGSSREFQTDAGAALATLRRRKKQAEQKKQKEEERLEAQIEKKQTEAEYVRRESSILKGQLEELYHPGRGDGRSEEEEEGERTARDGYEPRLLRILLVLAGVLALAGAVFLQDLATRIFLGVFGCIFLLLLIPVCRLAKREQMEEETVLTDPRSQEREQYLRAELAKREDAYQKLQGELEELCRHQVKVEAAETEIAALNLAIDRICELTVGMYAEDAGNLNQRASQILKEITGGRYDRIVMDETGEIRIHTAKHVIGMEQIGGGTMQQIYFAVRMAAGELFSGGTMLPLMFDEAFVLYDEERLERTLGWLHDSSRQVLVFTCQKREREIMNRIRAGENGK